MASKVKCTCGWSWNKSDSSKKDMYVCHECGRDNSNNMKNGGWLDNYGEEENANDSSVSLPEGYVGEGIFNGPIFENPAVKGQFQMGGSVYPVNYVHEAQTGGSFPGATGFSYARTGSIPSEGKYAKKTMASAQNGQEMQYYREGLDFQPKTISKNGSQLDKAQPGTKKFKLKDDRDLITKPAESTNVKKKNFDLEQSKSNKTYLNQLAEQQKENKRRKALTQDQREREDYNARNEERGSIQAPVKESKWDRTKAIVSNPLTAFGYAARNESLPTRFQYGERNALDTPIDFINPLQGVAALSEIPGKLGRGEYLNAGLSALDAVDLGVYAKGAMKASKPFLQKAGQQLGNIPTSIAPELRQGLRSNRFLNAYKKKPNFQSGINTMEELPPLPEDFLTKIKKLQESSKSINMLKEDLADPETIRRAEALGVDPEIFAEASKNMTYSSSRDVPSSYSSNNLEININPNQTGRTPEEAIMSGVMDSYSPNFTSNEIGAHELGHFFQDTNYWKNPYPKTISGFDRVMAHAKDLNGKPLSNILDYNSKYSTRDTAPTKVDQMLKNLEIRTGLDKEYYPQKNKNYFVDANKQYGTDVDNMIEKFPMFREYRQGMRDSGILKNKWDEITPEHIEDFRKLKPENRLNSFMEFNDKNYKLLNEVSKIAPAVLPIGLGVASQLEQKREGGVIKDDRGQWAKNKKNLLPLQSNWLNKFE